MSERELAASNPLSTIRFAAGSLFAPAIRGKRSHMICSSLPWFVGLFAHSAVTSQISAASSVSRRTVMDTTPQFPLLTPSSCGSNSRIGIGHVGPASAPLQTCSSATEQERTGQTRDRYTVL